MSLFCIWELVGAKPRRVHKLVGKQFERTKCGPREKYRVVFCNSASATKFSFNFQRVKGFFLFTPTILPPIFLKQLNHIASQIITLHVCLLLRFAEKINLSANSVLKFIHDSLSRCHLTCPSISHQRWFAM